MSRLFFKSSNYLKIKSSGLVVRCFFPLQVEIKLCFSSNRKHLTHVLRVRQIEVTDKVVLSLRHYDTADGR